MSAQLLAAQTWRRSTPAIADTFVGLLFVLADFVVLIGSFLAAVRLSNIARLNRLPPDLAVWMRTPVSSHLVAFIVSMTFVLFALLAQGLYSKRRPFWEELALYVKWIVAGAAIEFGLLLLLSEVRVDVLHVSLTWVYVLIGGPTLRAAVKKALPFTPWWYRPVFIVGAGESAHATCRALRQDRSLGYRVEAFIAPSDAPGSGQPAFRDGAVPILTLPEGMAMLARSGPAAQVILALDSQEGQEQLFGRLSAMRHNLLVAPPLRGFPVHGIEVMPLFGGDILLMGIRNNLSRWPARLIKRAVDVALSALLLALVFLPVYVVVAFLIRQQDKDPVFYRHRRIGKDGREFHLLKFRTMVFNADDQLKTWAQQRPEIWQQFMNEGFKLREDPRILKFGHFLRATSIDELPQLINVLRGDMSLVGPRPIVASEVSLYGPEFELYKQVRPGITGLWQVSGRSTTIYPERSRLDAWYVRNWSLWYDVAIMVRTVAVVARRTGAY